MSSARRSPCLAAFVRSLAAWAAALALASCSIGCGREEASGGEAAAVERRPYYDLVAEYRPAAGQAAARPVASSDGTATPSPAATAQPLASPAAADGGPRRDEKAGLLFLPAGSRAEYLLFAEADSVLHVERVSPRGAGAALVVSVETDEGGRRELGRWDRAGTDVALPLELDERAPARLVLASEGGAGSGVALARPHLRAPRGDGAARGAGPAAPAPPTPPVVAAGSPAPGAVPPAGAAARPNILIYLVDTLRPDRLGCYGYDRPTSPRIDAFAAEATVFENAVAQSSWTKAGVASIFTSQWPPDHGALGWSHKLPQAADTLAERLEAAGYATAAVVTNPNVTQHFDFDQGFDHFVRRLKTPSDEVNGFVAEWLDERPADRPFFLYVHTMDPHAPYEPVEPWRSRFAPDWAQMPRWEPRWRWPDEALPFLSALYDGEIAHNDASFGALLDDLRARGLSENTVVVFVSDHGEEFREHGRWRHGNNLHRETLDIPLIVKLPGQREGRRVAAVAQQIDVMPTLLAAARVPPPSGMQGRSLLADVEAAPPAYSHLLLGRAPEQLGLVDGDWKLLYTPAAGGPGSSSLYNWRDDRGETRDLAKQLPVRTAVLTALLHRRWTEGRDATVAQAELDPELESTLRSLGYLQ
jgi:arylsulfatase A-like enzyme